MGIEESAFIVLTHWSSVEGTATQLANPLP